MQINGDVFSLDKEALWDQDNNGFYYQLFIELWIYNAALNGFEFNNRFVGLHLNMTGST